MTVSHDPLHLATEAGRLSGHDDYEHNEEAVYEELWCCGYLDPDDTSPAPAARPRAALTRTALVRQGARDGRA